LWAFILRREAEGVMDKKYVLALDQGTTSSRAIIFDRRNNIIGSCQKEFGQIYPNPGWVEHDPAEILNTQIEVARNVLKDSGVSAGEIAAIGITNQRETTVVWDRNTGKPVHNAIVWQCRRTADICGRLREKGLADYIKKATGLVIDAYFSGTKIKWILDNVPGAREKAAGGELLFGTIDTWLLWNLTRGRVHATDYTNASRTMLYNIRELRWDDILLEELGIPAAMLPEVKPSSFGYGFADPSFLGEEIPITGIAGDQHAALFGQACFEKGSAKNTYGTGCFILMNTGDEPVYSENDLITTIAWGLDGKVEYALEGSVFNAGSAIKWLRDEMKLIGSAQESNVEAEKVPDTGGVYVVPAFTGLGAPYWDMYARGAIVGITRGTRKEHIIRATLESIAYQSRDVLEAMESDCRMPLRELKVDGGASVSDFLMQFQADILGAVVRRPRVVETTALGAAYLAGLAVGFWKDRNEFRQIWALDREYVSKMDRETAQEKYRGWKRAVERSMDWAKEQ
jgi:glycerol kinase